MSLPGLLIHKDRVTGCRGSPGEAPGHASPPTENNMYTDFKECEEVSKTEPLDFMEDDVTWVASKLSGATGALGGEAIQMRNYLIRFGCALEYLRAVIVNMDDWIANCYPVGRLFRTNEICCLVALDKRSEVHPMVIYEMLCRSLAKLVMRAAGDQTNTPCINLQMCAGLKDSLEAENHAVGQRRRGGAVPSRR